MKEFNGIFVLPINVEFTKIVVLDAPAENLAKVEKIFAAPKKL